MSTPLVKYAVHVHNLIEARGHDGPGQPFHIVMKAADVEAGLTEIQEIGRILALPVGHRLDDEGYRHFLKLCNADEAWWAAYQVGYDLTQWLAMRLLARLKG